jgi:integrase
MLGTPWLKAAGSRASHRHQPFSTIGSCGFVPTTSTWAIERAIRSARPKVAGLPEAFRFHDLRHYLASLLIGSGLDVKVVQHRLRHGSAKTTLDTYGHLWPDSDESARAAVAAVLAARVDSSGTATASVR